MLIEYNILGTVLTAVVTVQKEIAMFPPLGEDSQPSGNDKSDEYPK